MNKPTPQPTPVSHTNTTDATQGEPLAVRARARRKELAAALAKLPADRARERGDIELALTTVDNLLTGDPKHLSDATGGDLNKWLEGTKHLAEKPRA